jgi:hypothetical protein
MRLDAARLTRGWPNGAFPTTLPDVAELDRHPAREGCMAQCEVCGNDYYLSFEVVTAGETHVFDSFECAIYKLAPVCDHCGCRIIGHGVEANGTFYCCAHCAHRKGANAIVDHA